ncbi:nuclear transport factor 2 family protein [Streptomyces sp. NPDC060064]|uniref:nuclear transport factor 2 family protein n=1 Tax=Streptomyces sp. NPDC060064 TaxID=3347049 RepID=UPI003689B9B0
MDTKKLMVDVVNDMFIGRDAEAVDRYVAPEYLQHSPLARDGRDALRQLVLSLPDGFDYELVRLLADEDLVLLHGVLRGIGSGPSMAFDLFRVRDGRLVEHWDALAPYTQSNGHGRPSQTDGPADIGRPEMTEGSRRVVDAFTQSVLVAREYGRRDEFVDLRGYVEHGPRLPGVHADQERIGPSASRVHYRTVHRVLAEGEFAFAQCEGAYDDAPYALYDLFRVNDGRIAEHWGVHAAIPSEPLNHNGAF